MSDPSRFVQGFDFSAFQELQPSTPLPGVRLDIELANIETSTTELVSAVKDVRRSDGKLKNEIVTQDSLAPGLVDVLTAQTGADAVEQFAEQAEAAADAAATSAATLASAVDVIAANGFILDWGRITEPAGQSLNYGRL